MTPSRAQHRSTWSCLLLVGSLFACAGIDRTADHEPLTASVRIPFTLTAADNLSIAATLNGRDAVQLMFHTGVDSVSLTKDAIARLSQFRADGSIPVGSWGGTTQARHSTGNTLQIGDATFGDVAITECDQSGAGTDGKFGPSLFAGKVVEIDFDRRELVVHAALPTIGPRFERLDLTCRHGAMFVTGEVVVAGRRHATEFLLHTGYGGTALLDRQFVQASDLAAVLVTIRESELQDSYGHVVKTRTVCLPGLHLGAIHFTDVPAGIFDGALGAQRTSILGTGLLKRCHLVFDPDNGHLYVAPSQLASSPFAG